GRGLFGHRGAERRTWLLHHQRRVAEAFPHEGAGALVRQSSGALRGHQRPLPGGHDRRARQPRPRDGGGGQVAKDLCAMSMREKIEEAAARYPDQRSAIMPALLIAQQEHGHLPGPVLEEVADILGVERIWVYELATFYTLFHTEPVGMFHLQLCD